MLSKTLIISALIIALSGFGLWALGGFNKGWSKTQIEVHAIDEITEIEYTTYEDGFVAGLDALGASIGISLLLASASFVLKNNN